MCLPNIAFFDVGYNAEIKVKLTPKHAHFVYIHDPPAPIHLRDEVLIKLALLQAFTNITTLTLSEYSCPIFVHLKSSGILWTVNNQRHVNHLIRHDYSSSKFPISIITDATNHFARKSLFCKLDCSQAYHSSAILGLQYVILCDTSFHGIGFVLLVQEYLIDQKGKTEKTYAPFIFCLETFYNNTIEFFRCF